MKTTQYDNPSIGCYFDGASGQQYNDIRVLKLAMSYGWQDADAQAIIDADELTEEQQETLADVVWDAAEYLNSLETRSLVAWRWHDGDFGLYADVDMAKEDCEFVSSKTQEYPPEDYRGEWLHVSDHGNATLYVRGDNGQDKEVWGVV